MQKWEYKVVQLDRRTWVDVATHESLGKYEDRVTMLNKLGEAGWELITTTFSFMLCVLTFKRALG